MFPFFFAPRVELPLSGDIVQDIEPRLFSPEIAGDAETEWRIHRNVASYGSQLDVIMQALQTIAKEAQVALPEVDALMERLDAEKAGQRETLRRRAEEALAALRAVDEEGWEKVRG
ncbi:MAG: hypothetical protein AAF822_02810 [Pseudomonadota bacterium]